MLCKRKKHFFMSQRLFASLFAGCRVVINCPTLPVSALLELWQNYEKNYCDHMHKYVQNVLTHCFVPFYLIREASVRSYDWFLGKWEEKYISSMEKRHFFLTLFSVNYCTSHRPIVLVWGKVTGHKTGNSYLIHNPSINSRISPKKL